MLYKLNNPAAAATLFYGWEETLIYSCLQGAKGCIYALGQNPVLSAAAVNGDFCFFAGEPSRELAAFDFGASFLIMVPQNSQWELLIQDVYNDRVERRSRYALKKEAHVFDEKLLKKAVAALPQNFEIKQIDTDLYSKCKNNNWSCDLVSQYRSYKEFEKYALGFVITENGEPVSGASAYSHYSLKKFCPSEFKINDDTAFDFKGGIEIEIDTKPEYRRMGLAFSCGAALILACLNKGLYPSWDAHNLTSLALAEKLGYHFSHEYTVYIKSE